jgi:uncharacterized membrane protein YeaQ/YmgE (transglycosylase-associated protein family)
MLETSAMDILTLLLVGLVAGVLASLLVPGAGFGIIGDLVVGVVGAFLGAWLFRAAGWSAPWGGLGGTIFVATIGAIVLLLIIHVIHGSYWRRA